MQTPTVIYMIIDEYQQLISIKSSNQDRNGLGVICNALGNCKSILSEKANSMFIPILAGLDDLSLERAVKISSFPYVSLSTTKPLLNYWDFVGFFDNFCKLYPEKADLLEISYNRWITNNNINNLLHFISGLPRLASQMFKTMITANNWEEFDLIFNNNKFGLPQSWDSTTTIDKQVGEMILAYALTETTVSRRSVFVQGDERNVQYYEQQASCRLIKGKHDNFIVALPHWNTIKSYTGSTRALLDFAQCLHETIEKKENIFTLHDRQFETFNAKHLIALVASYILIQTTNVSLKTLFKGAFFSPNIIDEPIQLLPLSFVESNSSNDLFREHLQFKNRTTKSFDRKLKFMKVNGGEFEIFIQDRGIHNSQNTYQSLPNMEWSEITKIISDLPKSSSTTTTIALIITTKYISNIVNNKMKALTDTNLILIANSSIHSNIDRNIYGIHHFYGEVLFNLLCNVNIPKTIFIKEVNNDDILLFLFGPIKQALQNIKLAIPKSSNLSELIANAGLESRKEYFIHSITDNDSERDCKIFIDFSTFPNND